MINWVLQRVAWSLLLRRLMRLQLNGCQLCQLRKLVRIKRQWPLQRFSTRRRKITSRWLSNSFRRSWKIRCIGLEISWCSSRSNKRMLIAFWISIRFISIQFFRRWITMGSTSRLLRKQEELEVIGFQINLMTMNLNSLKKKRKVFIPRFKIL